MKTAISLFLTMVFSVAAHAQSNVMDELNPFDPNVEQALQQLDEDYQAGTGQAPILDLMRPFGPACYQMECPIFIHVNKASQTAVLYVNGIAQGTWLVSTGAVGFATPDFDTNPNGRVYDSYTSTKYPGGDYNGLGNMPYAVFISGGFAIHGTGESNWPKLGKRASHGCIRVHPDNARIFNRLVRQYGIYQTWITVN